MRRTMCLLGAVIVSLGLSSCYLSPVIPPTGILYTNLTAPQTVAARGGLGARMGKSSSTSILGLFATGDASVSGAAKNGGISTINHTDYEFFSLLGIYQSYTTVVYGD